MINILIVDDQTLMRDGLKTILDIEDDMQVVAVASNGKEAYKLVGRFRPDIVLMDIRMPIMDGVESTRLIKRDYPDTVVIMLTTFNDEEYIINALSYGANGYFLKDIEADRLLEAVRKGVLGDLVIPGIVAAKLASGLIGTYSSKYANTTSFTELSQREKDVANLIVKGMSNKDIALHLYLTEGTVKNYISIIYSKIGVNNRSKAVLHLKECLKDQ